VSGSTKVIVVTGASSGIGTATARLLKEQGHIVYGAARNLGRLIELRQEGIRPIEMDLVDEASMQNAISHIIGKEGRIDVLVNNAGYGSYGALEDVSMAEARRQFEVNVFGGAHLTQLVLPHMRKQGNGTIINVSSVGGRASGPLGSWYHATKWALEALSDCLRLEVKPFGINVVVIQPGAINTGFLEIATEALQATSGHGAYAQQADGMLHRFNSQSVVRRQSSPKVVANAIAKAVNARRPNTRYVVGLGAGALLFLRRWLPDRAWDALITRVAGTSTRTS
jgi:NAD(P)-dependent dehydrogenase (short-subunit alcohol dehydrogenase family)